MKKKLFIILTLSLFGTSEINACSMYKSTKNGKTIVGNNEDYFSPNSQFWFEEGSATKFGVLYMGLLDNFAQGAINDAGLVFDGFFEPYLAVTDTLGKLKIPIEKALLHVMQTMQRVEEVKAYLKTIDLSVLTQSQLVFVDSTGTYLIVEGDTLFVGEEPEKSFSNFYYSQVSSIGEVDLDYFQNGQRFLEKTSGRNTLDYCAQAMKNFAQKRIAPTQYSTVYDLKTLTVRVYLFHDFSNFVEVDLKKELKKGNHRIMIAELFPEDTIGYQHYLKYNNPEHPSLFLEEYLGTEKISEEEFTSSGFDTIIISLADEWLYDKSNAEGAIKVCHYGISLMPNNSKLYCKLGSAYLEKKDWNNAIKSYAKSLHLDPENSEALDKLTKAANNRQEKESN
ncbi:tetratricopeptide repeat protein [Maribacter sp. 2307UL18-2]|uniref:tetratricopeptide repeat protein n=1 Tax=Maribacter sp. 2307UL18-2 TaxID=3386274 RepID=UPI0039BD4677